MPKSKAKPEEPKVDLLGQLDVDLVGVKYKLRPSRVAISNIEQKLGKSVTQLAVLAGSIKLSLAELGVCVAELMNAYGTFDERAGLTYTAANPKTCADLIYETGQPDVSHRIAVILTGALAGGYTASGEVKAKGMMTEPTPTAD